MRKTWMCFSVAFFKQVFSLSPLNSCFVYSEHGIDNVYTNSYTNGMSTVKTAISLEQSLFQRADQHAASLKISRSRVIALALEDYLHRQENLTLLEEINTAYDDAPDPDEERRLKAAQRSFSKVLDEW